MSHLLPSGWKNFNPNFPQEQRTQTALDHPPPAPEPMDRAVDGEPLEQYGPKSATRQVTHWRSSPPLAARLVLRVTHGTDIISKQVTDTLA